MDDFLNYYRNEAPLYGKVAYYDEQIYFNIESDKLDSQMIRDIRDYVTENGSNEHDELDEEFADADKTHIDFYSTDNAIWISMSFRIKDGSVDCSYDKSYAKLPKEYASWQRRSARYLPYSNVCWRPGRDCLPSFSIMRAARIRTLPNSRIR